VLFSNLTKHYVIVSNYPGTSVEVSRGKAQIGNETYEIIDTPGMYSLSVLTEEERVARSILINERPGIIVHVVDAKNLERMLPLTLQLIEAGFNVLLLVNIMDEAQKEGIIIDIKQLENELNIPVISAVSTKAQGISTLRQRIAENARKL